MPRRRAPLALLSAQWAMAILALTAYSTPALGQTNTGEIAGIVRDSTGGVLPGAIVTVSHSASGTVLKRVTDGQGRFLLRSLPIGQWDITATLTGFAGRTRRGIVVEPGRTPTIEFTLTGDPEEVLGCASGTPLHARPFGIPCPGSDVSSPVALNDCDDDGRQISFGHVRLCPSGFVEFLGTARSDTANPSVPTDFGSIPLTDSASQAIGSFRHSRVTLESRVGLPSGQLKGYYSNDFLGGERRDDYRVRQLWGEYQRGRWSVLAGQAWSLTRFTRRGLSSDSRVFDTDVLDPNYFVGLLGSRPLQIRGAYRANDEWQIAVAYEKGGGVVAKAVRDQGQSHVEVMALVGGAGRIGFAPVFSVPVGRRFRVTTQHFLTKGAGDVALGVVPPAVWAYAGFGGLEWRPNETFELFTYQGFVFGGESQGNRRLWESVAGVSRKLYRAKFVEVSVGAQYAAVNRAQWHAGSRTLHYGMLAVKVTVPNR